MLWLYAQPPRLQTSTVDPLLKKINQKKKKESLENTVSVSDKLLNNIHIGAVITYNVNSSSP
jgi:hypothetical protein